MSPVESNPREFMKSQPDTTKAPLSLHESLREKIAGGLRLLVTAAALVLAAFAFSGGGAPLKQGLPAPDLHLTSYDGQQWDLSAFKNRPVVVNFWASWCPPCRRELPDLKATALAFEGDLAFVGAAVNSPREEVFALLRSTGLPYPVAAVHNDSIQQWQATSVPVTVLLDKNHVVVWSVRGAIDQNTLTHAITSHLGLHAHAKPLADDEPPAD